MNKIILFWDSMPRSYNQIWIHAIWSTKFRKPLIDPSFEAQVHQFLSEQLRALGCPVRIVNGMPDHVHCLFLLSPERTIADVIKQIKGSSSYFINQQKLTPVRFSWQGGYAAFSVSSSGLDFVYRYIKAQKDHHRKVNAEEEYEEFIRLHQMAGGEE